MKKRTKKRIRITNKRRFTFFCMTLVFLFCCGFSSVKQKEEPQQQVISIFVKPGDTLWELATENNPNNMDVRRLIYDIQQLNELDGTHLSVGDEILIPV